MNIKKYDENKSTIDCFFANFKFYSSDHLIEILKKFCNFQGAYLDDYEHCSFASEIDEYDEDYFGDTGVGFFFYTPGYEDDMLIVLNYQEFYNEVEKTYKELLDNKPEIKGEVNELLESLHEKINNPLENENTLTH